MNVDTNLKTPTVENFTEIDNSILIVLNDEGAKILHKTTESVLFDLIDWSKVTSPRASSEGWSIACDEGLPLMLNRDIRENFESFDLAVAYSKALLKRFNESFQA